MNLKIFLLLFIVPFFACSVAFAQTADTLITTSGYVAPFSPSNAYRTWSIGVHAGIMSTFNVFQSNDKLDFTVPNIQYGYGGYVKKQIWHAFGIQGDLFAGKLNGDNAQPNASGVAPYKSFSTPINYAVSLSGVVTLANVNWKAVNSIFIPYVSSGIGSMNYAPTLTTTAGVVKNFREGSNVVNELFVPVGIGVKFAVTKGVNVELGYQVNFVYSDNIDGYNYGGNNDKFSYAHFGLEFAIGKRSKPQLAAYNPVSAMRQEYQSHLGEMDARLRGVQAAIDSQKTANKALRDQLNASRAIVDKLTMDSDGDGVPDYFDKCPNTPAGTKVDGSGCPLPAPVKPENVYITEEDKSVVNAAVKNLEFETGSAIISTTSYPSLEILAKLLIDKKYHLKLAGYTDATGSAAINLQLSKDRAEAVKIFVVSHGADPKLIETAGYGKAHPIASNKTKAGRKLNRRVEFTLF